MALREEWQRSGGWLYRWRSYPPLALAVLIAGAVLLPVRVSAVSHRADELWELLCLLVGALGIALRAYAVGHAPRGTSGRNTAGQQADVLNTTGLYSVVRHPLYLGNFLLWLGAVMVVRSPWAVAIMVLAFWLYYERIMFAEEEYLRVRHGPRYEDWAARTPAFIPRPSLWCPPELSFSLRAVLRREYSGVLAFAAAFAFADWVEDYAAWHAWLPDRVAVMVAGGSALLYLALRHLKKHTRLLNAPGR